MHDDRLGGGPNQNMHTPCTQIMHPFQIVGYFCESRYITFAMHFDKYYVSRFIAEPMYLFTKMIYKFGMNGVAGSCSLGQN